MSNVLAIGTRWWEQERAPAKGNALVVEKMKSKTTAQTKMMSVKSVANVMDCSIWKIYDRIKDGSLFAEWDGGQWRVPEYAIGDFYAFQRAKKKG